MTNIYICYNATGEVERWDTVSTKEEANIIIQALMKEDEEAAKSGVPVEDCAYFAMEE